jgi:hypothetical protein
MARLSPFRLHRVLLAAVALLSFAAAPAWAQFETRATNPLFPGAFSIATGDFNHDGKLDIAVIGDNGFMVSLGNGDGTFQKPTNYSYSGLGLSIAAADFNRDGKIDLVITGPGDGVSVFLGNGDGTFQAPITSSSTAGPSFVVVGDFNDDKIPDLAIIDTPYISVLLGKGDGTFQAPSDNDSFVGPQRLALGDFNNDHKLDVVVVGFFGGSQDIGVLVGNGDGTLQTSLTYPLTYVPWTVATGDFNGDGNLDAVVANDGTDVTVFLGNGDGSFQPGVTYFTTGFSGIVIVSDLSLDGKLDLAIGNPSSLVTGVDVFWGNGDGTFQPAQFFASGGSGLPAVGDLNGDHLPDFVLANETHGAITMLNTGVVSFSPTAPLTFPAQLINTKSAPEIVKLTNNGTAALSISSIKVSGEFQASNTCGSTVPAGESCTITGVFRPKSAGSHTGLITLVDSASAKPQEVELSGSGTIIKVAPSSLNFGSQKVGTKSEPQVVTAINEGKTQIEYSSISIGGSDKKDFSETDNCTGRFIPPGGDCKVSVTFAPTKTGTRSAALHLTLQGTVSPQPVALSGTGT